MRAATEGRPLRADAERNRRKILDAASVVFAREGIDVTLDDVAREAGVGVGTVYRRFANKLELIDGVFQDRMDEVAERAERALDETDPWQAVVGTLEFACERMSINRGLGDVLFTEDEGRERVARARERIEPAMEQLIRRAQDAGELRDDVTLNDLMAISCMVEGVIDFTRPACPESWRRYLAIVTDGLRAPGKPRSGLPVPALTDEQVTRAKAARMCTRR